MGFVSVLTALPDAVEFLLNAEVGEGGDTQFRGDIGAYLIVFAIALGQFLMKWSVVYLVSVCEGWLWG